MLVAPTSDLCAGRVHTGCIVFTRVRSARGAFRADVTFHMLVLRTEYCCTHSVLRVAGCLRLGLARRAIGPCVAAAAIEVEIALACRADVGFVGCTRLTGRTRASIGAAARIGIAKLTGSFEMHGVDIIHVAVFSPSFVARHRHAAAVISVREHCASSLVPALVCAPL